MLILTSGSIRQRSTVPSIITSRDILYLKLKLHIRHAFSHHNPSQLAQVFALHLQGNLQLGNRLHGSALLYHKVEF